MSVKPNRLKITFNNQIYQPNDRVCGVINFDVFHPINTQSVYQRIKGTEKANVNFSNCSNSNQNVQISDFNSFSSKYGQLDIESLVNHRDYENHQKKSDQFKPSYSYPPETKIYFNHRFCVHRFSERIIPYNQYEIPFQFKLPKHLPNSFLKQHHPELDNECIGEIKYQIKAELDCKVDHKTDIQCDNRKTYIFVVNSPSYDTPLSAGTKKSIKKCCFNDFFMADALLERRKYYKEDAIKILLNIDNGRHSQNIHSIRIQLYRNIEIISNNSDGSNQQKKELSDLIVEKSYDGCKARDHINNKIHKLLIPRDLEGGTTNGSFLTCSFSIVINFEIKGNRDFDKIILDDVYISHINLYNRSPPSQLWESMLNHGRFKIMPLIKCKIDPKYMYDKKKVLKKEKDVFKMQEEKRKKVKLNEDLKQIYQRVKKEEHELQQKAYKNVQLENKKKREAKCISNSQSSSNDERLSMYKYDCSNDNQSQAGIKSDKTISVSQVSKKSSNFQEVPKRISKKSSKSSRKRKQCPLRDKPEALRSDVQFVEDINIQEKNNISIYNFYPGVNNAKEFSERASVMNNISNSSERGTVEDKGDKDADSVIHSSFVNKFVKYVNSKNSQNALSINNSNSKNKVSNVTNSHMMSNMMNNVLASTHNFRKPPKKIMQSSKEVYLKHNPARFSFDSAILNKNKNEKPDEFHRVKNTRSYFKSNSSPKIFITPPKDPDSLSNEKVKDSEGKVDKKLEDFKGYADRKHSSKNDIQEENKESGSSGSQVYKQSIVSLKKDREGDEQIPVIVREDTVPNKLDIVDFPEVDDKDDPSPISTFMNNQQGDGDNKKFMRYYKKK